MATEDHGPSAHEIQLDEFYLDLQNDGRTIKLLDETRIEGQPYPGLRPFRTSEHQLFNGRAGQADQLVQLLSRQKFLAVIGSSGTGKSSLVRAGLIPHLFSGYLEEAGYNWDIAISRPGNDPIRNLAVALSSVKSGSIERQKLLEELEVIEPILRDNPYGIVEVSSLLDEQRPEHERANLLIIVDQFEELFRYKRERKDAGGIDTAAHFTNLLIKATSQKNGRIYVVITMRSEYLGECVQFRNLPEAINKGQFLVPRLNRSEIKEAIQGPIVLAGYSISPSLVNHLIDEVGDNMDQLPILQHSLMRTYDNWKGTGQKDEIDFEHYEAIGKMEKALAAHADEIYRSLGGPVAGEGTTKQQQIARIIFQALTDRSSDDRGIRRPTKLKNIYAIAGEINASETEVNTIINQFRGSETSFLMPPANVSLHPELVIDISHESLMRNWKLLDSWIREEVEAANLYKRLNERRQLKEEEKSDWVRGGLLEEMLSWQHSYPKNAVWASRYHESTLPDEAAHQQRFDANMKFLQQSDQENQRAIRAAEERTRKEIVEQQREKSRKRRFIAGVIGLVLLLGLTAVAVTGWISATRLSKKAEQEKELAEQSEQWALQAKAEADTLAIELEESVRQQRALVRENRLIAEEKASEADRANLQTERVRDLAEKLNDEYRQAVRIQKVLEENLTKLQEKEIESNYYRDFATKEPWINDLDEASRTIALSTLFDLYKTKDPGDSVTASNLKQSYKLAADARREAKSDQYMALYLAREAKLKNANPVTNATLDSLLMDKIAFEERIVLSGDVQKLAFSENNRRILAATSKGTLHYFDLAKPDSSKTFRATYRSEASPVALAENGKYILFIIPSSWTAFVEDVEGNLVSPEIKLLRNEFFEGTPTAKINANEQSFANRSEFDDLKQSISNQSIERKDKTSLLYDIRAAFIPSGNQFIINDGGKVASIYDLSGRLMTRLTGPSSTIYSLKASENYVAACTYAGMAFIWDHSGKSIASISPSMGLFNSIDLAESTKRYIIGLSNYSAREGAINGTEDTILMHKAPVNTVAYLPDGKTYITVENDYWLYLRSVHVWQNAQKQNSFNWHNKDVTAIAVSADGDHIASASDGEIYIWKPDARKIAESDLKDGGILDYTGISYNYFKRKGLRDRDSYYCSSAIANLTSALKIDSTELEVWLALLYCYSSEYQYSNLSKAADRAALLFPGNLEVIRYRGIANYQLGNDEEAIADYERYLQSKPDDLPTILDIGGIYFQQKNYGKALDYYRKAAELDPKDKYTWNDIGFTYEKLEQYDLAIESYQKSIAIDSMYFLPKNNLAYVYLHLNDFENAIKYCGQAASLSQLYPDPFANRGFAYIKTGRNDLAVDDLNKAAEIDPNYSTTYVYMAAYHMVQNNHDLAYQYLEKGVDKGYNNADWLNSESLFEAIRSEERFTNLIRRTEGNL